MNEQKTIFYIFNLSKAVRNFGKGGIIEALVGRGFRVVAFGIRPEQRGGIKEEFGDKVEFEDLGEIAHRGMARRIERLVTYIWRSRIDYQAVRVRHGSDGGFKFSLWAELMFGRILQLLPVSFWERLQEYFSSWPQGESLLQKYHPDAVLISNPIDPTANIINWVKARGIYTGALIESWDNLTIRGGLYTYPDELFVWGNLMKNEACEFHKFPPHRVITMGLPSFDIYWRHELYPTEAEWREQAGLPPGVPVVSYATSPSLRQNQQDGYLDIMMNAVTDGRLPKDTHFLVRIHREDDPAVYQRLRSMPNVCIQTADASFREMSKNQGQAMMLAATMRYSTVVVNLFSTTVLDAMANGTPSVTCAFDPSTSNGGNAKIQKSIRRFLHDKHIRDLVAFGAVSIADDAAGLVHHVGSYLKDKSHMKDRRELCLRETLGNLDGTSAATFATRLRERLSRGPEQR